MDKTGLTPSPTDMGGGESSSTRVLLTGSPGRLSGTLLTFPPQRGTLSPPNVANFPLHCTTLENQCRKAHSFVSQELNREVVWIRLQWVLLVRVVFVYKQQRDSLLSHLS